MNELPSNEYCWVVEGWSRIRGRTALGEFDSTGRPMGLMWPSVPRASYLRQEIRETSLSQGGGTGMRKGDKRERGNNMWGGRKERNCTMTQRWLAGIFLPSDRLVYLFEFLTLINFWKLTLNVFRSLEQKSPSDTRQRAWNYGCKKL